MNGDVVSVTQYSLPLPGYQRKEMNIVRSNHNPHKILQIIQNERGLLVRMQTKWKYEKKIWHRVTRNYCYGVVSGL